MTTEDLGNIEFKEDDFKFAYDRNAKLVDKTYNSTSYIKDVFSNFAKNKGALIGVVIIIIIVIMAIIGPYLNFHTYKSIIIEQASLPPKIPFLENFGIFNGTRNGVDIYLKKGFSDFILLGLVVILKGRDIFTRVWAGTRVSLIIAVSAVLIDIFYWNGIWTCLWIFWGGKSIF